MRTESERGGAGQMFLAVVLVYFLTLILVLTFGLTAIYPRFSGGIAAEGASIMAAVLTLPGSVFISGGYKLPGKAVSGLFGALAGLGALYLPTGSILLGAWEGAAPVASAAAMLLLVLAANSGERLLGDVTPSVEVALTMAMFFLVLCPTFCLCATVF